MAILQVWLVGGGGLEVSQVLVLGPCSTSCCSVKVGAPGRGEGQRALG